MHALMICAAIGLVIYVIVLYNDLRKGGDL